MKLHNISVRHNIVKKIIMSLDLLKASDPDGILGVNIKSCGPELSYILNELFSICLRESCL